jgi:hypothetical protein
MGAMPERPPEELASADDPALGELREAGLGGELVLFVGSGVSAAAGLPSWRRLVELLFGLARVRGVDPAQLDEIGELSAHGRFLDALTAAKAALGASEFSREVERQLDDRGKKVPEIGKAIAALAPRLRALLTTNLDHLLERALGGEWPMLARGTGDLAQRRAFILKLHGTLLDRATWVITRDDHEQAMYADPQLGGAFSALFQSCPMLFVGYGLADDDFDHLLERVRAFSGPQPPRHFALVAAGSVKPFRRRELEQAGLRLITCHDRDETLEGSARVLRALAGPPAAPRTPSARPPAPPPAPSRTGDKKVERGPQPPGAPYKRDWYVHREEEESRALSYLETAGAPVVLWAPELFGKSTMLRYLLDHLQEQDAAEGKQSLVIELDLSALVPSEPGRDLDGLLENIARSVVQQVPEGDEAWVSALAQGRDPWPIKLRKLLQKHVLPAAGDRLFVVVERADEVWGLPFQGELYGMFRNWCELGHKEPWARLRVLMALSTTPSLVLDGPDGSRSPWNLVAPIELSELGLDQVEALARLYQLDWPREAIAEQVVPLVGGHPHHLRTLMYKASLRRLSLDALLAPSSVEGLFSQHFGKLIKRLEVKRSAGEPPLEDAVRAILDDPGASLDETTFQRLLGAGLLTRGEGGGYRLRYSLDEGYLRKRWAKRRG